MRTAADHIARLCRLAVEMETVLAEKLVLVLSERAAEQLLDRI